MENKCINDYGIIPLPKGPDAYGYCSAICNARYFSLYAGDPDIENAGALMDAIANRTNLKTTDVVANNTALVRDEQSVATLTNEYKYAQILNLETANTGKLSGIYYGAVLKSLFKQQITPKQALDSIAKPAQTVIDTLYGQS